MPMHLTKFVKVVYIGRSQICLQCVEDGLQRNFQGERFDPVHISKDRRVPALNVEFTVRKSLSE